MKHLALGILLILFAAPAWGGTARHVLIVANNNDPDGDLPTLRYADDDGARFAELFSSAGAKVELLTTMDAESQPLFPDLVGQSRPRPGSGCGLPCPGSSRTSARTRARE